MVLTVSLECPQAFGKKVSWVPQTSNYVGRRKWGGKTHTNQDAMINFFSALLDLEWSRMCDSRQEPLRRKDLPWMWGAPSHGLQTENECKCKNRGQMSTNICLLTAGIRAPTFYVCHHGRHKSPYLLCMSSWLPGNCLYHLHIKQNNLFLN